MINVQEALDKVRSDRLDYMETIQEIEKNLTRCLQTRNLNDEPCEELLHILNNYTDYKRRVEIALKKLDLLEIKLQQKL
jgi:hypothetical protein